MVPSPLVTVPIDDGRALVEKLVEQGVPVTGAYWLYTLELAFARLYIVSPSVDQEGLKEVYLRIHAALSELSENSLSLIDIAAESPRDPFVQAVRRYIHRSGRVREVRISGVTFNNVLVDDMYVYWLD